MKILLLGNSAAGKTSLLTAIYGCMQRDGTLGYWLECERPETHAALTRMYAEMTEKNEFPNATQVEQSFRFHLYSREQWLMDMTFTDTCGTEVHAPSGKLMNHIREADAVILCLRVSGDNSMERLELESFDLLSLLRTCFAADFKHRILLPAFLCADLVGEGTEKGVPPLLEDCARNLGVTKMSTKHLQCEPVPISCQPALNVEFLIIALAQFWYENETQQRKSKLETEKASIARQMGEYDGPVLRFIRRILNFLHLDFLRMRAQKRYEKFKHRQKYYEKVMLPELERLRKAYEQLQPKREKIRQTDREELFDF